MILFESRVRARRDEMARQKREICKNRRAIRKLEENTMRRFRVIDKLEQELWKGRG